MNKQDLPEMAKIINVACEMTGRKPLSNDAVLMYAALFKEYSIEQIRMAVQAFLTSDNGRYPLTPAAILDNIGTGHIDAEKLVDMALVPRCEVGYMARKLIGTWDLDHNRKQALATARRIIKSGELDKEVSRARAGELTKNERNRLQELGIDLVPESNRLN